MTLPAAKPMPRPSAEQGYNQQNEHRYRRAVDDELGNKHDKRSDIRVGANKYVVFQATDGTEYGMGLDANGLLTLTNYSTGDVGSFSVDWERVSGLSEQLALITTAYETDDAALSALISINASAITTNEGAIATLETDLAAEVSARTTGDSGLQTQVNARATISYVDTVIATEESARASADSALQAQITSNDGDITSINATVTTHTTAIADLDATKAEASTVTALTATVTTIGTDLDAAEAAIVTNTAAISTNATAIATNEGAIATLETSLRAEYRLSAAVPPPLRADATGTMQFEANKLGGGAANDGEIRLLAGFIDHPTAGRVTLASDSNRTTPWEGSAGVNVPADGVFYLVLAETTGLDVRFPTTDLTSSDRFFTATYDAESDVWRAYGNSIWNDTFTPEDGDVCIAIGTRTGADSSGIDTLRSVLGNTAQVTAEITSEASARASADSALASDISTIEAEITAARDGEASLSAKIASVETAYADADTAIAADVTALDARITTNEGDITSIESAATALDARVTTVEADYATATSVTALTATVSGNTSDIAGNTADIATNAAAITTEASARASADSAAATRLDALEATVDTPTTGLSAVVSSHTTAIADLDSTKAEASTVSTLSSTVSTLASDLTTAEGDISALQTDLAAAESDIITNAASITTEASTRASADSSNASSITSLAARVQKTTAALLPKYCAYQDDFTFSRAGDPATVASATGLYSAAVVSDADLGQCLRVNWSAAGHNLLSKGVLPIVAGRVYEVRIRFKVSTLPGDGTVRFRPIFAGLTGTYTNPAGQFFTSSSALIDVTTTGVQELVATIGDSTSVADAVWPGSGSVMVRGGIRMDSTDTCTVDICSIEITDVTDREGLSASVTVNASAIANIEGNLSAAYGVTVDVNGRIAALKLLSDGTSATAALLGDLIYFGDNTVFEDTYNTFYTTYSSYRLRSMGPFGSSSDLLLWYGPTSVSLNSETKTNGVMALATDGKLYVGSDPANALSGVTLDSYFQLGFTSAGTGYSDTVTATAIGGDGTYTYLWTRTGESGPTRTTCSNTGIQTPTFSVAAGGTSADTWTCTVTETSTGRSYQASVKFDVSLI